MSAASTAQEEGRPPDRRATSPSGRSAVWALTYDHLGFREDIVMTATGSANWRAAGACLTADPDLFFPISTKGPAEQQIMRAKMICAGCGVRRECLEFALSHDLMYGIWGGTTPEDRQRDRRRKRRAAAAADKAQKRIVAA